LYARLYSIQCTPARLDHHSPHLDHQVLYSFIFEEFKTTPKTPKFCTLLFLKSSKRHPRHWLLVPYVALHVVMPSLPFKEYQNDQEKCTRSVNNSLACIQLGMSLLWQTFRYDKTWSNTSLANLQI
jgi:hypothetical protein